MATKREANESPVFQGADEVIAYTMDFSLWGTPTSPVVTLTEADGTDVTSTKLTGSASVAGDVVTCPAVTGLVAGEGYVLRVKVTINGNTMSAYCKINCDAV